MHEMISEFKLILLNLNNYSIAVKWFLSNYCFYFLLLDERSYQPTPSRTQEDIKRATCSSTAPKISKTKFKFNSCTTYCREDGNSML
jgi:hypothetical protein